MQNPREEFAAEGRDFVLEQFQEQQALTQLDELADRSHSFVFTVRFPKANGLQVGVPAQSEKVLTCIGGAHRK